jgi:hypothetical protein
VQKLIQKHAERIKFFEESIKSDFTRKAYTIHLNKYIEHLGSKFNSLLEESNSKKIEQSIIDYIILLKKTKGYSAIHNYVAAIIAFYKINDIILNIDKISRLCPIKEKQTKTGAMNTRRFLDSWELLMKGCESLSCC